ncbi:MAG: hypothetical protein AUF65_02400 [Chloroflexi bacterium 13_1_20CM_50_12]|nr:MAG: hypothetical protein AUF65_02400 [Chloroflexi bacterium 13_1_20CM_50_12]
MSDSVSQTSFDFDSLIDLPSELPRLHFAQSSCDMRSHCCKKIPSSAGIYRITCTANEKVYIGSSVNLRKRHNYHFEDLKNNKHANKHLQRAWCKYGPGSFVFEVIELVLPPFLVTQEQYWIDTLQAVENGFNIMPIAGSTVGRKVSDETRTKLVDARQRRGPISFETRAKMSASHKAENLSLETRAKLSASHKAENLTPETRMKISNASRNRSSETRAKISKSNTGKTHSLETRAKLSENNKGKKRSTETRAKMREAQVNQMATMIITDPNGIEYKVTGIKAFCKSHGLCNTAMTTVAQGKQKNHKGWISRYADKDESTS